jgi:predicted Zn-dependent protease
VNAFALPGGYIYLTRGLIYLCQNEAQLAGVIAHEIGHVTGRHSAKRYTTAVGTNLLGNLLNILIKNPILQNLTNTTSSLYLLSYSRKHEYEADSLATRYMIRAGFDPYEMANFLKQMERYSNLQKKIIGDKKKISELLLTHPNSSKRIMEVINSVDDSSTYKPIKGREIFLKKIDGMLYGDKPEEGFFYKNTFIHKPLDFFFNFDESIFFINNPNFLMGLGEKNTKIFFDIDTGTNQNDLDYFSKWSKTSKKEILDFRKRTLNNFIISECIIKKSDKTIGLALIKDDKNLYRFSITTDKNNFENYKKKFFNMVYSFGRVSKNSNIVNIKPPKIRVLKNSTEKNFIKELIKKSSFQKKFSEDIFMTINNVDEIRANQKIKTIY